MIATLLGSAAYLRADPKVGCSRAARLQDGSALAAPTSAAPSAAQRTDLQPAKAAQRVIRVETRLEDTTLSARPWFRAKPAPAGSDAPEAEAEADPREPIPEYRCKVAPISQCRDTNPNPCSSQASELRDRARRYGKLANPPSIGMSVPVLENDVSTSTNGDTPQRSTLSVALAPSAVGLKWRLTW